MEEQLIVPDRLASLIRYLAVTDPASIRKVIYEFGGVSYGTLDQDMAEIIHLLHSENKIEVMNRLMIYHPDRDLIMSACDESKENQLEIEDVFHRAKYGRSMYGEPINDFHARADYPIHKQGSPYHWSRLLDMSRPLTDVERITNGAVMGMPMFGGNGGNPPNAYELQPMAYYPNAYFTAFGGNPHYFAGNSNQQTSTNNKKERDERFFWIMILIMFFLIALFYFKTKKIVE